MPGILGMQPAMEERALDPESEGVVLNPSSTFASQRDLAINPANSQFFVYKTEIKVAAIIML